MFALDQPAREAGSSRGPEHAAPPTTSARHTVQPGHRRNEISPVKLTSTTFVSKPSVLSHGERIAS